MFKQIQTAYAILSDHHERRWYDDHRDEILRGRSDSAADDPASRLWAYFNSNAYSGFGDDENSFFSVYDRIFAGIDDDDQR